MNEQYINDLALRVFEQNKAAGWWDNMDRDIHETLMLVVTEIAEATEGVRKDLMDDHLPHRKMEEVELADTAIRLLDLAGRYGWKYQCSFAEDGLTRFYACQKSHMPEAAEHLAVVELVVDLARAFRETGTVGFGVNMPYSMAINRIFMSAESRGFDLESAIEEKLAYNRNRADHKRENREKEGGKKF